MLTEEEDGDMPLRVHHPAALTWRNIGEITPPELRTHLDPGELASHIAFHENGDGTSPQLLEMRLEPDAVVVPHSHDTCEIVYVAEGEMQFGDACLNAGGSLFIPANTTYSYRAGAGARLLNFRPTADHSLHLQPGGDTLAR